MRGARIKRESAATAITEMLVSLDPDVLSVIATEVDAYLDDPMIEKRALATAARLRLGGALPENAVRDPEAFLIAIAAMQPDHFPASPVQDLKQLVEDGTLDTMAGVLEVKRLSPDKEALFVWLATLIDPALELGFDEWGEQHIRAMAGLKAMHAFDYVDWPVGYEDYAMPATDPEVLVRGHELFHMEEEGCVKCHGIEGQGIEGFPPLAHSPWVLGDPRRAAAIVAHGLTGPLTMPDGQAFDATMDPVQKGSLFSDADVAAILTYVRQNFGNYASPVTFADVQAAPTPADLGSWITTDLLVRFPMRYDRLLASSDAPTGPSAQSWSSPRGGLIMMLATVLGLNGIFGVLTFMANRNTKQPLAA